jgi:broad specificity phosphatase PhoE
MDVVLIRHGESEANRDGRMQGSSDHPLTELGTTQAESLGKWLASSGLTLDALYASPLLRARRTAEIVQEELGVSGLTLDPDLAEISLGKLEGLTRSEIAARHPEFLQRPIDQLADFAAFGGESLAEVDARVQRVFHRIVRDNHARGADRIAVVAHGGLLFQLVKRLICLERPRLCLIRWGNCTAALVRMQMRRGTFLGELMWHVPVQLMENRSTTLEGVAQVDGVARIFR